MASPCWFYSDVPGIRLNEAEIAFPSPRSAGLSEDDGSLVSEQDTAPWTPIEPAGSIYICETSIPRPMESQDFESFQHFLPEHYHRKSVVGFDREVNLDPFSLAVLPTSERHQAYPVFDVRAMGSPVNSLAESQSVTDYGSSAGYAWSDRGSDAGGPYQGTRRPSERETTWTRPSIDYGPNMMSNLGYPTGFTGGSGYVESIRGGSFVDPRQVQQSPVVMEPEPKVEEEEEEEEEEATTHFDYSLQSEQWSPEVRGASPGDEPSGPFHIKLEEEEDQNSDHQLHRFPMRRSSRQDQGRRDSTGRVTKHTRNARRCSDHPGLTFSNTAEWRKHMQTHERQPFSCIFASYGCQKTFGSKNEWKRHINRLHLCLDFWRCDLPGCNEANRESPQNLMGLGSSNGGGGGARGDDNNGPKDFNRKDLFTQHLRRMHRQELSQWTEGASAIQERCRIVNRAPPNQGVCGFCGDTFAGEGSWDDCLEHVGKHFEHLEGSRQPWRDDEGLRKWMVGHNLLEETRHGITRINESAGGRKRRSKARE